MQLGGGDSVFFYLGCGCAGSFLSGMGAVSGYNYEPDDIKKKQGGQRKLTALFCAVSGRE